MTEDLITWLRARLDDTERDAPDVHEENCAVSMYLGFYGECRCELPARVLREVKAKRRILDLHSVDHECSTIRRGIDCVGEPYEEINNCTWVVDEDCSTVRLLALPYADHPEFQKDWRP